MRATAVAAPPAGPAGTTAIDRPLLADGSPPFGWRFSSTLMLAATLNPLNSSIIATALVPISDALGVPVGRIAVLVTCLYVASAVAQPAMGRFVERLGPRRVLLAGALLVGASGAVGAVGSSVGELVVARVLLGVGTSAGFPCAMFLIRRRADATGASPGAVLGRLVAAGQLTMLIGLPLGGLLVSAAGWRATFWVNVPLAALVLLMAWTYLPSDRAVPVGAGLRRLVGDLDLPGVALFAGALALLVGFLVALPTARWSWLAGAGVLTGLLLLVELRVRRPLIDVPTLLKNRALSTTYVRTAGGMLLTYTVMYGLTQWLQDSRGLSPTAAGLLIVPLSAAGALATGPVSRRGLVRLPLVLSALIFLGTSVALSVLTKDTPLAVVISLTAAVGVGVGWANVGNQAAVFAQATASEAGTAAGLLRTSGYLGAIGSGSLISIVFRDGATDAGLHEIAHVLVPITVLVLVLTVIGRRLPTTLDDASAANAAGAARPSSGSS